MNLDTVLDWVRNFALAKTTSEDDVLMMIIFIICLWIMMFTQWIRSTLSGMYETLCESVFGKKSHDESSK